MSKKIKIEKTHFIFKYLLTGNEKPPFVKVLGNDRTGIPIPPDKFKDIIKKEGSEALAVANSLGEKHSKFLQEAARQTRMLNGGGAKGNFN